VTWFELSLRRGEDGDQPGTALLRTAPGLGEEEAWDLAAKTAALASGEWGTAIDVYHVAARSARTYVATWAGTGLCWWEPRTGRDAGHLIDRDGHCVTCAAAGKGRVRHPVTPEEALSGKVRELNIQETEN
jgi:hypothetical protein